MKLSTTITLLLIAALLTTSIIYVVSTADVQEVDYYFVVNDSVGFDLETDMLRFGSIPKGATSNRELTITSQASSVRIQVRGEGSEYVRVSENPAQIINETKTLQFQVKIPQEAREGEYYGTIRFLPIQK